MICFHLNMYLNFNNFKILFLFFKFQVTVSELEIRTLWLSVWHSDRFGRNDFLGEVMLPLGNDTFESSGLKWYPLQERATNIHIFFIYCLL